MINREAENPMSICKSIAASAAKAAEPRKSAVDQFKAVMPGTRVIRRDTERSTVFRSDTGGESWVDLAGLRALPSADTWSFPN